MLLRIPIAWLGLLITAIVNGAIREAWLVPQWGRGAGQAVSTLTLSALILALGWMITPWIGPRTLRDAWTIGITWVVLTLGFEFLGGHFLFRKPWEELLADYDIAAGRIWVMVLIVTLVTPVLAFTARAK